MGNLERFKIDLKALQGDGETFEFDIQDSFFQDTDTSIVKGGCLKTQLRVLKTSGVYELLFDTKGYAVVPCDICLDDMRQDIDVQDRVIAKLGDLPSTDDIIVVPADEGILDVTWLIYESIALAIPTRHVHEEGACNKEMLERIRQLTRQEENSDEQAVDPRWSKLEKLKSTIKE